MRAASLSKNHATAPGRYWEDGGALETGPGDRQERRRGEGGVNG